MSNNVLFESLQKQLGLMNIPAYKMLLEERRSPQYKSHSDANETRRLLLLLVDYRPLIKYIDGVPCYLYVDVYSQNGVTFYRSSASGRTGEQMLLLDDVADLYPDSRRFIYDFAVMTGNTIKEFATVEERNSAYISDGEIAFTGSFEHSQIKYLGRNHELQAILYISSEMIALRKVVESGEDSPVNGRYRIANRMNLSGTDVSRSVWLKALYNNYMVEANLELMEYYYRNQKKPSSIRMFEMHRVNTFNEFVPVALKFSSIPNPVVGLMDEDGTYSEYASHLRESNLFRNVETVTPLSVMNGRVSTVTSETKGTFGWYATRAEISSCLGIDVSKRTRDYMTRNNLLPIRKSQINIDLYSPAAHMGLIYRSILQDLNDPATYLTPFDTPMMMFYNEVEYDMPDALIRPFTGVQIVRIEDNCNAVKRASDDCKQIVINKYQALVFGYMNNVFGTLNTGLLTNTPELTLNT